MGTGVGAGFVGVGAGVGTSRRRAGRRGTTAWCSSVGTGVGRGVPAGGTTGDRSRRDERPGRLRGHLTWRRGRRSDGGRRRRRAAARARAMRSACRGLRATLPAQDALAERRGGADSADAGVANVEERPEPDRHRGPEGDDGRRCPRRPARSARPAGSPSEVPWDRDGRQRDRVDGDRAEPVERGRAPRHSGQAEACSAASRGGSPMAAVDKPRVEPPVEIGAVHAHARAAAAWSRSVIGPGRRVVVQAGGRLEEPAHERAAGVVESRPGSRRRRWRRPRGSRRSTSAAMSAARSRSPTAARPAQRAASDREVIDLDGPAVAGHASDGRRVGHDARAQPGSGPLGVTMARDVLRAGSDRLCREARRRPAVAEDEEEREAVEPGAVQLTEGRALQLGRRGIHGGIGAVGVRHPGPRARWGVVRSGAESTPFVHPSGSAAARSRRLGRRLTSW